MKELITVKIDRNKFKHLCFTEQNENCFFSVYKYLTKVSECCGKTIESTEEIKTKKGICKTTDFELGGKYKFYFFDKSENCRVELFVILDFVTNQEFIFSLFNDKDFESIPFKKLLTYSIEQNRFSNFISTSKVQFFFKLFNRTTGINTKIDYAENFDTSLIKVGDTLIKTRKERLSDLIHWRYAETKVETGKGYFHFSKNGCSKRYSNLSIETKCTYLVEEVNKDNIVVKPITE